MIYTRKEVKTHGLGKDVEGLWQPGERVVIIEDVITSGGSIITTAEKLRALGLIVEDVVVLIDRGQGGIHNLAGAGIRAHPVFNLPTMLDYLEARGRMEKTKADDVRAFLGRR
jgi:orotate phosphoribosyltransferase